MTNKQCNGMPGCGVVGCSTCSPHNCVVFEVKSTPPDLALDMIMNQYQQDLGIDCKSLRAIPPLVAKVKRLRLELATIKGALVLGWLEQVKTE